MLNRIISHVQCRAMTSRMVMTVPYGNLFHKMTMKHQLIMHSYFSTTGPKQIHDSKLRPVENPKYEGLSGMLIFAIVIIICSITEAFRDSQQDNYSEILDSIINNPKLIQNYVDDPRILYEIMDAHPDAFQYITNQDPDLYLDYLALSTFSKSQYDRAKIFHYVRDQTPEICARAINRNPYVIKYIVDQRPELCMQAVKCNGLTLRFIDKQYPELCINAINNNTDALEFVKNQTDVICMKAVAFDGFALKHVRQQTIPICIAAVKQNVSSIKHVSWKIKQENDYLKRLSNSMY